MYIDDGDTRGMIFIYILSYFCIILYFFLSKKEEKREYPDINSIINYLKKNNIEEEITVVNEFRNKSSPIIYIYELN